LESVAVDGTVVSSYGYDENGNRTSADLAWSQLGYDASFDYSLTEADTEYDSADKLLTYGTRSYSWNPFGQLESMTDSDPNGDGDTSDAESTFYQYDLYGNLLRVDLPDGRAIEYDVDGAGRRVGRRELDENGDEISCRGWIYRDLLRPIAEVDDTGTVVARYVSGDGYGQDQGGLKSVGTRLGAIQETEVSFRGRHLPVFVANVDPSTGDVVRTLQLITDEVGSVHLVIDVGDGGVAQRLEYSPDGDLLFDSAPGLQPFGFAGGLWDGDTGLYRIGARD
jgi:YD repeat-containing protein